MEFESNLQRVGGIYRLDPCGKVLSVWKWPIFQPLSGRVELLIYWRVYSNMDIYIFYKYIIVSSYTYIHTYMYIYIWSYIRLLTTITIDILYGHLFSNWNLPMASPFRSQLSSPGCDARTAATPCAFALSVLRNREIHNGATEIWWFPMGIELFELIELIRTWWVNSSSEKQCRNVRICGIFIGYSYAGYN